MAGAAALRRGDAEWKRIKSRLEAHGANCRTAIDANEAWRPDEFQTLFSLGEEGKHAYWTSQHWRDMSREQRLLEPQCAQCGTTANLHAHHKHYNALGAETPGEDLETLCKKCHMTAHGRAEDGSLPTPDPSPLPDDGIPF